MPNFSKGGYYNGLHSRANSWLFIGLLLVGANVVGLPLLIRNSLGLSFVYLGYFLVAISAYKLDTKFALIAGSILSLAQAVLLSPYAQSGEILAIATVFNLGASVALSVGFGRVGGIARDFRRIKFSHEVPRAADAEMLMALLDRELTRTKRSRQPSSLAVVRLAVLERAQKAYGQHQTELLLRQIQSILLRHVRRSDTLAWLGDSYFTLLLPGTGREGMEIALERLRQSMQSFPARSVLRLDPDASDWRAVVLELKGDDVDAASILKKAITTLDPGMHRRTSSLLKMQDLAV